MESKEAGRDEMDVRKRIGSPHQTFDMCPGGGKRILAVSVVYVGGVVEL